LLKRHKAVIEASSVSRWQEKGAALIGCDIT
jgi:hypothetical protein